jgi:hypothetical protein
MGRKFTYLEVKDIFEKNGCSLVSIEYYDALTPLEYKCSCGELSKIRLSKFLAGQRCSICALKKGNRWTLKSLTEYYNSQNCELLATQYFGSGSLERLPFICSCGRAASLTFKSFRQGSRCEYCAKIKMGSYNRTADSGILTIPKELIIDTLCNKGFKLIKYNSSSITYQCSCGITQTSATHAGAILNIGFCKSCRQKLLYERVTSGIRNQRDQVLWSIAVKDNNKWRCVNCESSYRLHAHHIESFHLRKELRLDLKNGITFCLDCHYKFHKKYGRYTTRNDLQNFFIEGFR